MKVVSKADMVEFGLLDQTKLEKDILCLNTNPFLINMQYSFQTCEHVKFLMPFKRGGDMFNLMRTAGRFEEERAKFYIL